MSEEKKSTWEKIKSLDKKFAWSFVGVVLAIFFGVIGIYTTFFYKEYSVLSIELVSENDIINLSQGVDEVEILYNSENIKEKGQNLKLYTFKISNTGTKSVIESSYSSDFPVYIKLLNGEIISPPEIINATNNYLSKLTLHVSDTSENKVIFPKAIIEPGQAFTISLLILHQLEELPKFIANGKLEGQNEINITTPSGSNEIKMERKDFFYSLLIGLPGAILFMLIMFWYIGRKVDKEEQNNIERRKKQISLFNAIENYSLSEEVKSFLNDYANYGYDKDIDHFRKKFDKYILTPYESIDEETYQDVKELLEKKNDENDEYITDVRNLIYLIMSKYLSIENLSKENFKKNLNMIKKFEDKVLNKD